jgi:uncharacterized protein (DUF4415 family)
MKNKDSGKPLGTDLDKLRNLPDDDIAMDDDMPYDPDDPEAVEAFWKNAVVVREGGIAALRAGLAARNQQTTEPRKVLLALRYSPDVVEYFQSTGADWQVRMDNALREWIRAHGAR